MRFRSENLTTLVALTPGTAVLMCAMRASSSCFFLAAFEESPTRFSGMNALRSAVRQLADDLAKIAQSWAVVSLFTFALLFANAMALEEEAWLEMCVKMERGEETYMSWSSVTYTPGPISASAPLVPALVPLGPRPRKSRTPSALVGFSSWPFDSQKAAVSYSTCQLSTSPSKRGKRRTELVPCQPMNSSLSRAKRCAT